MKKAVLSKKINWIILTCLVFIDAFLDVVFAHGRGLESPIWEPIANLLRISNPLFMIPIVLVIFYFGVKIITWLTKKLDKIYIKTEELILTTIVIVYGIFDLWLIMVYFFNFTLFKSHYYLIPILIIIGAIYSWWAEKRLKKN